MHSISYRGGPMGEMQDRNFQRDIVFCISRVINDCISSVGLVSLKVQSFNHCQFLARLGVTPSPFSSNNIPCLAPTDLLFANADLPTGPVRDQGQRAYPPTQQKPITVNQYHREGISPCLPRAVSPQPKRRKAFQAPQCVLMPDCGMHASASPLLGKPSVSLCTFASSHSPRPSS